MEYVTTHGVEVPALGVGTPRFDATDAAREAVETALEIGYRHVDTAQAYGTEGAVGEALAAAAVDREAVFVTTKLADGNRDHDGVVESTRASVRALGGDYVDLLLIHSPAQTVPFAETIGATNELQDEGLVRHVGVSNFSVAQTREAMAASRTPVLTDQVEYHAHGGQPDLLEFCLDEGLVLTAYSPLAVGDVTEDGTLDDVGASRGETLAQVAIRWLLQQETVSTSPKAADADHLHENFDGFDFELSDDEMRRVFEGAGGLTDELADRLGL